MRRTLFILASLAFGLGTLGATASAAGRPKPTTIAVNGTGTVQMMPDQGTVNVNVMTNDDASGVSISQNNAIYNRVVDAVSKLGVSRSDVILTNYFVNYNARPKGVTPPNYERFGYTVNRSFSITVHDISKVGAVVDAASTAGVSQINGINFGLSNPQAARAQALRSAIDNAHREAIAMAAAAHLHLIGIKSLSLGYAQQFPRPMMAAMVMKSAPPSVPTELGASNVAVTVTVTAIYLAAP